MAMPVEFEPFDISEHLDSEEMIAGYLNAAAEDEDPNVLLGALMHVAKARGMMDVAKAAGLNRESLYKALRPGAHPRFETVQAVLHALGVKLRVSRKTTADLYTETKGKITRYREVLERDAGPYVEPEKGRGREVAETAGKAEPGRRTRRA
jgi:probable addiction module antidote protein